MNKAAKKILLAGDIIADIIAGFMPKMHLWQPAFTYIACIPFKNK